VGSDGLDPIPVWVDPELEPWRGWGLGLGSALGQSQVGGCDRRTGWAAGSLRVGAN